MDPEQLKTFLIMAPQLFVGACLLLWRRPTPSPPAQEPCWVGTGWDVAAFFSLALAFLFVLPDLVYFFSPKNDSSSYLCSFLGTCAYALLLTRLLRSRAFSFTEGLSPARLSLGRALLRGVLHYLRATPLLFLADIFWLYFLSAFCAMGLPLSLEPQELLWKLENASPLMLALIVPIVCAVAPFVEEVLFRGGVHRCLKSVWGKWPAAFLSSVLFATLHGNWVAFFPLFVLSLLLVSVYEREGRLLPCVCLHGLFNLNGILLTLASR
ncbi:MAG: CPBP family intramembrane metalloprotease [Puniceicoccales bacterium]|jgi:membrane protease YdiL (CAAX protease family)|nr:CPBP family intramembrane metalloprotease [Puniceicoccales bacterium]